MTLSEAVTKAGQLKFHCIGWLNGFVVYHPVEPPKDVEPLFFLTRQGRKPVALSKRAQLIRSSRNQFIGR